VGGLDSRVMLGRWRSPSLSLFDLRVGGREYRFNSAGSLFRNRSRCRWGVVVGSAVGGMGVKWTGVGWAGTNHHRNYTDPARRQVVVPQFD